MMQRRLVIAGLAALLAAPSFLIQPAAAAIVFSCDSVAGSAALSPGLVHDKRPQSLSVGPGNVILGSASDSGVKGNAQSDAPSLSADGTKAAFASFATNLDPANTDSSSDVYLKDLGTGDITLVSAASAGGIVSLSADGTKVAFATYATNLDPRDTDTHADVYVKDLTTGTVALASITDAGVKGNGESVAPSLSDDGSVVAFQSTSVNLDPADADDHTDVYVKDLQTGNLDLASTNDAGVKSNEWSDFPSLSGDGGRVAFASNGTNLDPRATTTSVEDVYVKELATGNLTLASTSDADLKGNQISSDPSLSGDGTRVAFHSAASNLDPADTDAKFDIYVKDLATGDITLASTSDTGVKGDGVHPSLSSDGARVAFDSVANLDPMDTSRSDVYVKDLATGDVTLASTSDAGVKGNQASRLPSLSDDGTGVGFISSSANLDPADTDSVFDVYVKTLLSATSMNIAGCSNGNSGTASIVDIRSYGPRPLGCPQSLGGAAGNDYPDTTPILVGATLSMTIDWASGPNSYGVAAAKASSTGTQWRFRLAITASQGHDTPATNQYLPAAGSGFTKTRLQGKLDWSALDSFNCTSGVDDPISRLSLANNGTWVAKTS